MLTELDLLEINMENRYKLEKTPVMQNYYSDKFEKIYQKVVDAKTEKEKGCADVMLIYFRTNLQIESIDGKTEHAKSSAQELLKRVELLKTLSEQKLAEKGNFVGAFSAEHLPKSRDQISKESNECWDKWGDKSGLDGLCGSSKYADLNELYG
jgi:hypothetical protein